mgnify:CR=1 FL=1
MVIWITGLSGAGKTTIAHELGKQLREAKQPCLILDGDMARQAIADPNVKYDPESRLIGAMRICRLAKVLEQENIWVIVSTMSLIEEVFQWNRSNFKNYFEVYIKVDIEILKQRDAKNLYSLAAKGDISDVVGIHHPTQEPKTSDLVIDNSGSTAELFLMAKKIISLIQSSNSKP